MKKILGLTIASLLVIGLVAGGTWAYFSDTEQSTNNSLSAGTLDLNVDGGNTAVTTFSVSAVAPGDSGNGTTTISNAGSIVGELDITLSAVTNTESSGSTEYEADGAPGELGGVALIAIFIDVDQSGTYNAGDIGLKNDGSTYTTALDYQTIDSYASTTWDDVYTGTLGASASDDLVIEWQVPFGGSADNTFQGDSVSFDVTFTLEQTTVD